MESSPLHFSENIIILSGRVNSKRKRNLWTHKNEPEYLMQLVK